MKKKRLKKISKKISKKSENDFVVGKVESREIVQEMKESYIDYAMSVIVSRALPDVRDGLKPVQRRILWSMRDLGLSHGAKTVKSARVVGECFIKNTLVLTSKGLVPIQKIRQGDSVYTQNSLCRVTQLYTMPPRPLLKLILESGISTTVTPSQKFKILTPNWQFEWKEAKDLTENDYLITKVGYPEINNLVELKRVEKNQPSCLNKDLAYLLGLFVSDGWISKDYGRKKWSRIGFTGNSRAILEKVAVILEQEFNYIPTIETKTYSFLNKQGKTLNNKSYIVRINRKIINEFFVSNFSLEGLKALTKKIPAQILSSPKDVIFSFISGLIEGDGFISANKNLIHYGSISEGLVDQLMILLFSQGIFSNKYVNKNSQSPIILGRKVKSRHKYYYLEIKGENAQKLASYLALADKNKNNRAIRLGNKEITSHERKGWNKYDLIPYAGKMLFQELSRNHLGSGWYQDAEGNKFREGIEYPGGCKIRYSSDLQEKPLRKTQVIDWGIKNKLERINSPLFDFLQNVIENKIYFSKVSSIAETLSQQTYDLEVAGDHEFIANGIVSHNCLGKYHPHGDSAVYDALVRLAQDFSLRYPLIIGQGNFGCFTKDTKVKLTDSRNLDFGELVNENKLGKKNYTYTVTKNGEIAVAEIKNPRLTKRKTKVLEVTLDNGKRIKCTPDHRFLLKNGSYKEAQYLKIGDSLMPAYSRFSSAEDDPNVVGYEMIFQPKHNSWDFVHILVDRWNLEQVRKDIFGGKSFTSWDKGFEKYYNNNLDSALFDINKNHKVKKVRFLKERADVYDLTISRTHNFALTAGIFVHNSIDGDQQAAQRYTECKPSKIGDEMLSDIQKNTVNFIDNYDGTRQEPQVLPSPVPSLLLNGSLGIAVGMATSIPTHNLREVCDALIYLIDHPKATTEDLFKFIKGPDFPTGGQIFNSKEILTAYSQGKGPVLMRGRAEVIENEKTGKNQIVISEIPFQVQKSSLIQQMAKLVQNKRIDGIRDIRDESDKDGLRITIDLQRDAYPQKVLNHLYKFTDLQKTFHLNLLALVDGIQPKVLSLVEILSYFLLHRKEVVSRRTRYDLDKAKDRAHILEGLHKCLGNIDAVIKIIKGSANRDEAEKNLMKRFKLTKIQTNAILETKLAALAKLERKRIEDELKLIRQKIKELTSILNSPARIKTVIKKETEEIKRIFGDDRRTKVIAGQVEEIAEIDLIPQEETIITLTAGGYIKRINPSTYKLQKRGGKGILGMKTTQEDIVEHFIQAMTHDDLYFFADSGKVFKTQAFEIPEGTRVARGRGLLNFLEISQEDKILSMITSDQKDREQFRYLVMVTKNGVIKKTVIENFANVRKSGLIAITLKKNDLLRKVVKSSGKDEIILITKNAQAIRFKEKDLREMGRQAAGIRGIRLKKGDEVIGAGIASSGIDPKQKDRKQYLLVVTENGYGKRTEIKDYRMQGRGGSGIKTGKITSKTGAIIAARVIDDEEDLIVISRKGQVIRVVIKQIPKMSRATQGVRIMRLDDGDKVASAACI